MDFPITVTESALNKIASVIHQTHDANAVFRVQVLTGGCFGFKYSFEISHREDEDECLEQAGARIVIDPTSKELLQGSVLDYVEDLGGAEFVLKNPKTQAGCGCGQSFSI